MRFLGRKPPTIGDLPPRLTAKVVSDVKRRPEGVRIKHRVGENSIKMYDKQSSVLRAETTINDIDDFAGSRGDSPNRPRAVRAGTQQAKP
jgi:hypothetical protein